MSQRVKNELLNWATILYIIIFTCLSYRFHFENKLIIGVYGSIITLYYGILKQQLENDKVFKEIFETFNKRYDENINDTLNKLRNNETLEENSNVKNYIYDYFNLCAEEYLWYKKGRIDKDIWEAWKAGIIENLKIEQVKKLFDEEKCNPLTQKSYYGLIEELEK